MCLININYAKIYCIKLGIKSEKHLKAFKKVRKYVQVLIKHVNNGTFPTDFKNSALEDIMNVIAEQTEIFKGAKHAFMWNSGYL